MHQDNQPDDIDPRALEIDQYLNLALSPTGGRADNATAAQALAWLVANAEVAHPRLIEILDTEPEGAYAASIIEILPVFGLDEDVSRIAGRLHDRSEFVADTAGRALGRHPAPQAFDVLTELLYGPPNTAAAAALGLAARGDRRAEPALRAAADRTTDPTVRYRAWWALDLLGCIEATDRRALSTDPDPDIRSLFNSD